MPNINWLNLTARTSAALTRQVRMAQQVSRYHGYLRVISKNKGLIFKFKNGEVNKKNEEYKFFLQSVQQNLAEKRHHQLLEQ